MNTFTASTLALMIAGTAAFAQQTTGSEAAGDTDMVQSVQDGQQAGGAEMGTADAELIRSRDITGGTIYTMSAPDAEGWDPTNYFDQADDTWTAIGEIEDLVLSRDGQITAIVAEVGGFLDVGDKHVVIPVEDVNLVAVDDREYGYLTRRSEEDLKAMEDVDEGFWD